MSTISRRLGSGGKMYVPRDRYSLTMSFCVVPRSSARRRRPAPRRWPRRAPSSHAAVALIVIDVFISPGGMPSSSVRMWPRWATGTPTLPTSPRASGVVGVVAGLGRQVEGDRQAGLALGQVGAVQLVRRRRRGVARVGPHQPRRSGRSARSWRDHSRSWPRHTVRRRPATDAPRRASERRYVAPVGDRRSAPSDGEVRASPTARRAASRPSPAAARRGATSATFDASRAAVEHRLAGEEAADAHAVEAADELAVVGPRLDAVRPARARAAAS